MLEKPRLHHTRGLLGQHTPLVSSTAAMVAGAYVVIDCSHENIKKEKDENQAKKVLFYGNAQFGNEGV